MYRESLILPGPRRVLPFFRLHKKKPNAAKAKITAKPPMVPPTIAPVFLVWLPSLLGAAAAPPVVDGFGALSLAAAFVVAASELVLVSESVDDWLVLESDKVDECDPIVVGSERVVGVAVKATDRVVRSKDGLPEADTATLVAKFEAEPHPY